MSITLEASRLVHCVHTPSHVRRVVPSVPAKWCSHCGAIWNGAAWQRPDGHSLVRAAIHANAPKRLAREKRAAKSDFAARMAKAKAAKAAKKGAKKR